MAVRYTWQCPKCQTKIELATTQAGQDLKCASCSAEVMAPRLGDIKRLPVVGGQDNNSKKSRKARGVHSPVKSWLFTGGLLLAVLSGIAGAAAHYNAEQYRVEIDMEEVMQEEFKSLDAAPPAEIYAVAVEAGKDSFALEYREPTYRTFNLKSGYIRNVALAFWGAAVLGFLMLLGSFFVK